MPVSCPLVSTHRQIHTWVYIHTFSKIFVKYNFKSRKRARTLKRQRQRQISSNLHRVSSRTANTQRNPLLKKKKTGG